MPINIKFPSGSIGVDTSDATATAQDILEGETAYSSNRQKITGTIPSKAAATYTPTTTDQTISGLQYLSGPQIIKGDNNLIPANIANGINIFGVVGTVESGVDTSDATAAANDILLNQTAYIADGSKAVGTIPLKAAQSYTPTTSVQTISSGQYLSGVQTIAGDVNLVAGNIKNGLSIFGVAGNYTGLDTSDATATAAEILLGKTAYVNDTKITGTIQNLPSEYQVIAPSAETVVIYPGYYIDQGMVIAGEPNLISGNIKAGKTIFGVSGDNNVIDTTEAVEPASSTDIQLNHVAFVNGTKITGTMVSKSAQTYTPSTTNQTIASQQYLIGAQTILGDANLIASNIKQGTTIFGVEGTYLGGSGGLVKNWCFKGGSSKALETYGSSIFFKTISSSNGPSITEPTSLSSMVAQYSDICDSNTNYNLKIGNVPFGWGSTVKIVFTTPIYVTPETIFLNTVATRESATLLSRLVQASGTGTTLATNIFTNSKISGNYVDISGYLPNTENNFVTTVLYNTGQIPTGTYYIYLEITANNFVPRFNELFQYVIA